MCRVCAFFSRVSALRLGSVGFLLLFLGFCFPFEWCSAQSIYLQCGFYALHSILANKISVECLRIDHLCTRWDIRHNYYYVGHISWMSTPNNNSRNSLRRTLRPSGKFRGKNLLCACFLESSSNAFFLAFSSHAWWIVRLFVCLLVLFSP